MADAPKVGFGPIVAPGGKIEDLGLGVLDPIRLGELLRP